jgi:hypothetical protein
VVYDNLAVYVVFYDETGENVLHIVEAAVGDNVVYPGETPTKENTAQYTYTFAGWSATPGGSANPNILNNITLGGNVYAVFTKSVRTYTVRFINGSTVLQTVSVPYGGNATYTGNTPVKGEDYEFLGWEPVPVNVTADMDCYAQYKNNNIYTWEAVAAAIADGTYKDVYKIGDLVPIDLGSRGVHDMEIVAFDADDKADGSGKAAITWISKKQIAKHAMNTSATNENGWEGSAMRTWLQTDIYNTLHSEVKSAITPVNKSYYDYASGANLTSICADIVWIPSAGEIFGNNCDSNGCENSGAEYTSRFTDPTSCIKYNGAQAKDWWLRTASSFGGFGNGFRNVNASGAIRFNPATEAYGVVLGFCT